MFAHGTECRSAERGLMRLRPLDDERDRFPYPIFTARIEHRLVDLIRFVWQLLMGLPDPATEQVSQDREQLAARYLVTVYACYAGDGAPLSPLGTRVHEAIRDNGMPTGGRATVPNNV
ncbi:hypothetical protein X777_15030 [Ooceraea biroi]|uniref:Uncharacterized protein n=1 Tax=Ooceraea biroi TaxID=2015173 RepID=A0A026VWK3_OOCBI|nr:hypothetical protein X777_15030 [Ooceraea biroi]